MDPPAAGTPSQAQRRVAAFAAHPEERELVAAILRNDRKAAARLVHDHADAVYAYVRHRLLPRVEMVDDVVQEVFLAALNGLVAFEGQSSLRVWLIGIARHKIEDVYRQQLRLPDPIDDASIENDALVTAPPFDEHAIDATRAHAKARRILTQLPKRYALVLLWRYWEQRRARDMAAAIGTTEKSIERMLARARAQFKALWLKE